MRRRIKRLLFSRDVICFLCAEAGASWFGIFIAKHAPMRIARIPPRGGLADAIRYTLNRWEDLCCFLNDSRIELPKVKTDQCRRWGKRSFSQELDLARPAWTVGLQRAEILSEGTNQPRATGSDGRWRA